MKCIVTGGSGLLGLDLLQRLPPWNVYSVVHPNDNLPPLGKKIETLPMDLTDRKRVLNAVSKIRPDVVVHAASIGDLDACERRPEEARELNVGATQSLLEACHKLDTLFVFLSTIYVFDGSRPPYGETDTPSPLGHYARMKLEAESIVLAMRPRSVILRPMTLFGWHLPSQRTNCVTWLLDRLCRGDAVQIVDDVFNNHLWVGDASRAVLAAIQRRAQGIFHLGGPERLSRYHLSLKVADVFGFDRGLVSPVSSDRFPSLAPRPRDSTCLTEKMERELGIVPLSPEMGLETMRTSMPPWAATEVPSPAPVKIDVTG